MTVPGVAAAASGATVERVDPLMPSTETVARAVAVLRRGRLVALPTETVYGLAADARRPEAVRRIFAAKGRPADNPLIVHVGSVEALDGIVRRLEPLAADLARRFWPGPLTLVVDAAPALPSLVTAGLDSVAVRVPDHPVFQAVLRASGLALAAPSANRSGRPSPTTGADVVDELADRVDLVLDAGPCPLGVESTVVDARGHRPVVLRAGAVTHHDLGLTSVVPAHAELERSPGTRYRHYAPTVAVRIAAAGEAPAAAAHLAQGGRHVGLVARDVPEGLPPHVRCLARPSDADALARMLYATFRRAEALGLDAVVVEAVAEEGIGLAVMDRLRRAAAA